MADTDTAEKTVSEIDEEPGMPGSEAALDTQEFGLVVGEPVRMLRGGLIVGASLAAGWAVATAGAIGFVGLVVPHLLRLLTGPNHRTLLPASALLGATLLILADLLSRTIAMPAEVPIGIVTALLGAPFFLYLLRSGRKELT